MGSDGPIGLDARLYAGDFTGIGIYTRGLVDALAGMGTGRRFVLFTHRPFDPPAPGFEVVRVPVRQRVLWTQLSLPARAAGRGLALFHGLANHELPLGIPCPTVATVHDLIPLLYPRTVTPRHRFLFRVFIGPALRKAAAVVTDSEWVRRSLVERFGVPREKVHAIPLAADPAFSAPVAATDEDRVAAGLGVRRPYVLYVGALEPRKNLPSLIRAFAGATSEPSLRHWSLVLAGGGGWYKERTMAAAAASGLGERLVVTGHVPAGDLPALYRGASLFCLPSLYEGFGLPLLEAMASGVPVLVSAPGALEELAGDAGVTFRLDDPDDLPRQLGRLLRDEGLRHGLAEKGKRRAAGYTWERCARETLAVYERVLGV